MLTITNEPKSSTILVVDDDITGRFMVRESLEQIGFEVQEAENGKIAVELAAKINPDIILLDVMMPEMDGFTACTKIREIPACQHTPIMMMTGLDDLESINKSYQVGATDFITKPINYLLLSHRLLYMLRAKQTADELRASQHRLDNAQRIARIGYWEWDCKSNMISWSSQVGKIFGLPEHQSIGDLDYFFQNIPDEEQKKIREHLEKSRKNAENYKLEHSLTLNGVTERIVYQEAEVVLNDHHTPSHYIGMIQDITERKQAETKIDKLSHYDKLTGLPNRSFMRTKLGQAISIYQNSNRLIALLTLDLDHFKRLNDTLGHSVGDQILQTVAKRVNTTIQHYEYSRAEETIYSNRSMNFEYTLAHFGGDEFVIMMDGILDVQDAAILSRQINDAVTQPMDINGDPVSVSASIGISAFPEDGNDVETLLKQSSAALYHAKNEGRNCYKYYTSSMNTLAFKRLSLEANLRRAIEQDQFELYYQPKVVAETGMVMGMEALIRWRHPELGIVSPVDFIPIAEQTGMIIPISEWVFREACRQLKRIQQKGLPLIPIAVNISSVDFAQENLASKLKNIVDEMQVDSHLIELEITESLIMNDVDRAIATLDELKKLGFSLAIDDFGTGYSSLSYLKRFPVSTLKLDMSFIRDIHHDHADAAIVRAVIALAHSLDLKVVAEGVEKEEQLMVLKEKNCDILQGYFYSPPLAKDDIMDWIEQQTHQVMETTVERFN